MNASVDMAGVISQAGQSATLGAAANAYLNEQTTALAEKQLDVNKLMKRCYYALEQYTWNPRFDEGDEGEWTKPIDPKKNVLSEEGVQRIMQALAFVINQSNLLSNFTEQQIKYLMLTFLLELNDLHLQKYEFYFRQPTLDECYAILEKRTNEKAKLIALNNKFKGTAYDEEKIRAAIVKSVNMDYELENIKIEQRRQRLREWPMLLKQVEIVALGALNRALNGEERGSLRRHTQMLEMLGAGSTQQAKETGGTFKSLFK